MKEKITSAPTSSLPVLIVGAGPTGLTFALELARRSIPVRIIDKVPVAGTESRAMGIWPRTVEQLEKLGVAEQFLKLGNHIKGLTALSANKPVVSFNLDGIDSPYPFLLALPQNETERLLSKRLSELGVEVERPVELLTLEKTAGGVRAKLAMADARQQSFECSFLIGCDGAHSAVRKTLELPFHGAAYPEGFGLGDVRVGGDLPEDRVTVFLTPDGPVAFIPFRERGRFRVIVQLPRNFPERSKAHGRSGEMSLEYLQRFVAERVGRPGLVLSDPIWLSAFHVHRRTAKSYRDGNVFLVGDAAHIHSPVGGQGMNTGIQDAFNLAWKVALAWQGRATEELLQSYHTERHPVARSIVRGTDALTRAVTIRSGILQALRNETARLMFSSRWLRAKIAAGAAEIAINYRKTPLVAQFPPKLPWEALPGTTRAPEPGERAPDAIGGGGRIYDRLRRTELTALLFSGQGESAQSPERLADLAATISRNHEGIISPVTVIYGRRAESGPDSLSDPEGRIHARYCAKNPCLYLVRPDGYVSFRSQPILPEALAEHLSKMVM